MADFYLGQGNRLPVLVEDLYGPNGKLLDLTSSTVQIIITPANGQHVPERIAAGSIVGAVTSGRVQYVWQAGDSDIAGPFYYQWRVTYTNGLVIDVPNGGGYRQLEIQRKL